MSIYAVNGKDPIAAWIPSLDSAGNGTTTLTDLAGSNSGTLTNMDAATDWVADTGAGGVRALDFDGTNDFVSLPNTVQIPDEYTICGWVKIAANRAALLGFSGTDSSFTRSSQWGTTGSRVPYFQLSLSGGYFFTTGGTALNAGQWYHLAFTRSGATAKVYVNGVDTLAATSGGAVGGMLANTNTRRIGSTVVGSPVFADSRQDDIRIFNQVLTLADIEYLYAGGFGRGITPGGGIIPILRQHYAAQGAR